MESVEDLLEAEIKNRNKLSNIEEIPVLITEQHHHVLVHWIKTRIIDAEVLHIDAHPDINPIEEIFGHIRIGIDSYLCYAFHKGIISSIYWLNPHERGNSLYDFGTRHAFLRRRNLDTYETLSNEIFWKDSDNPSSYPPPIPKEKIILTNQTPLIVDVDLDAFSCQKPICGTDIADNPITAYESRIDNTVAFIKKIKRPNLICITRSQGDFDDFCSFVPAQLVDKVQSYFLRRLNEIYSN